MNPPRPAVRVTLAARHRVTRLGRATTPTSCAESRMEREKALALYDKLLATNPDVQRKGDTMPYTSLNGNMFSLFTKENRLTLRLPAGERELFLARYKTTLSEQYGHVQPDTSSFPMRCWRRRPS